MATFHIVLAGAEHYMHIVQASHDLLFMDLGMFAIRTLESLRQFIDLMQNLAKFQTCLNIPEGNHLGITLEKV